MTPTALLTTLLLPLATQALAIHNPYHLPSPPWQEWVYHHIVWQDETTETQAVRYVDEYFDHNLPVGMTIIDSPWETGYNTFDWEPRDFLDPQRMVDELHSRGVKVLVWIVPNINIDSPNWDYAYSQGYFLNDGQLVDWWKGEGAFIDYTNPAALAYWHSLMDKVLALGIDGWKLDGTDPYVAAFGAIRGFGGPLSVFDYQDSYYRDFFEYSRSVLGVGVNNLSRGVDSYEGLVYLSFTPREIHTLGWTGDHDPTFHGLRHGLLNMLESGRQNYVNDGSEVGGYRGDGVREPELMVRWGQMAAFSPVFINGGAGEHRPWIYGEDALAIYRTAVEDHYRLIPYFFSQGAQSYWDGVGLVRPTSTGFLQYMLGDNLFIAPIWESESLQPTRQVDFPEGEWINWFTGQEYAGGTSRTIAFAWNEYPAYIRKGAIIPLYRDALHAQPGSPLDLHLYYPETYGDFRVYEESGPGFIVSYTRGADLRIAITPTQRDLTLKVHLDRRPREVTLSPYELGPEKVRKGFAKAPLVKWSWNAGEHLLTIYDVPAGRGAQLHIIGG